MGKVSIRFLSEINWQANWPASVILNEAEVHVYRIAISSNLQHLEALSAVLTSGEKERGQKYHQVKDRRRFVVSRGTLRHILARYTGLTPSAVNFAIGGNKKPYLQNPGGVNIQYNISHAGDYILLAVSNSPVGADVEYVDPDFPFDDILNEHFSEAEVSFISNSNTARRFYLLWTRKEALLKATSQGLGEHLSLTPSLDGEHAMPAALSGADKNWAVSSFDLPGNHIGSVANVIGSFNMMFFNIAFD